MTFGRAHAGEVDTISSLPIVLAQVLQVYGHHGYIGTPVFQSDEHSHAYFVYTGLSHAVESVYSPFEDRFHAFWVVYFVPVFMIGFLKADHAVKTRLGQAIVIFAFEGHDFYR